MKLSRRHFLKGSAALSATTAAATLPSITSAADMITNPSDHKALVCVFLFGGNDAYNMVVPVTDSAYTNYLAARPDLGLKLDEINTTGLLTDNDIEVGLHHAMSSLLPLFQNGQATALVNTGQLIQPTTRSLIDQHIVELPEFLMAHNMQQEMWQSGAKNLANPLGWAGRMMDMLGSSGDISPLISIGSDKKLLRSKNANQTIISSAGVGTYNGMNTDVRIDGYFNHFTQRDYSNLYTRNYSDRMEKSIAENEALKVILDKHPANAEYPEGGLASQLKMVGRLIKARGDLTHQRQVFFVGMGGFDTHKDQKVPHHNLLAQLSDSLAAFNTDMENEGLADQVTCVTMSDFGRRVQANASGTDHGWAGHQIVTGGAISGGKAYGQWPDLTLNSENDYNKGRIIPGIAADQVNASLCKWFGLNDTQILELFPNLVHFEPRYIDFIC
ncbi:hypothetical protein C9J12_08835 [Photobacterium frigidiphilum]|uniref:DUF1501 domain-containing protein n=1 Tax=Photobacterium frigidiphilum TaxID=264736 RepID=A0A2T3JJB0_9GAMM|nr:DUF1501 domain-containing protein [Photobacterium frigidiphilum]PSU49093.1 hypothetical protein C9J12_08835 [Photobacterium frigidiphilum]